MEYNMGGLDDIQEEVENEKVTSMEEAKTKRPPFHYWTVKGRDYKLKLKASAINKLENKYKQNIINLIDDIPPLSVMLTIIQAAMEPWEHGIGYQRLLDIYDSWTEEGGNQTDLFTKVIIPTLVISGFFPADQADEILKSMADL